jgi:hypothetical protein
MVHPRAIPSLRIVGHLGVTDNGQSTTPKPAARADGSLSQGLAVGLEIVVVQSLESNKLPASGAEHLSLVLIRVW